VKQLDRLEDRLSTSLRPRAKLGIKKMCFCSATEGYGKYVPRTDAQFFPGQLATIYVELENLTDQRQGNGTFAIHLLSHLDVRDFNERIWLHAELGDQTEWSFSARHDFHSSYLFKVDPELPPGFYTLYLTVVDQPTRRTATGTLDFRVVSPHP